MLAAAREISESENETRFRSTLVISLSEYFDGGIAV